jgi:cob(I)alamin adenosyltransferase
MPKRIYTRRGDEGFTSLITGERVSKTDQRIITLGAVDELSAVIGVAKNFSSAAIVTILQGIQINLFHISAEISSVKLKENTEKETSTRSRTRHFRLEGKEVELLEVKMDEFSEDLPQLNNFLLPGGTKASAYLHMARTICRRTESEFGKLSIIADLNPVLIQYINRLSDFLFICARYANFIQNTPDEIVKGK